MLVLINGPLTQCLTYLILIKIYPYSNSLDFLKSIHYTILIFNMLPIYPLDGGKLLNLFLSLITSFKRSFEYTIIISYINILILSLFLPYHFKLNYIFLILFLLCKVTEENKKKRYYFDKFLLERYLYSYCFTRVKIVSSLQDLKRGYRHIINNSHGIYDEDTLLDKKFYH